MVDFKVTVTIPVYNTEKYLSRCIESVLSQSYRNIEILIVNDCSPDSSNVIIDRFMAKDKRIRVINHPYNMGLMRARETGYRNACGDYILFLDSDDTISENSIEILINEAENSDADIVCGQLSYVLGNDKVDYDKFACSLPYGMSKRNIVKALLEWNFTHNLCGKLFKKKLFTDKVFITKDNWTIAEDGLLFYQLIDYVDKVSVVNSVVYNYYRNNDSSTQVKYTEKALKCFIYFYDFRYRIVSLHYNLKKELDITTLRDLCILCGMGYKASYLNYLLNASDIPIRINRINLINILSGKELIRCLLRVYVMNPLRRIKNNIRR